MSIFDKWNEAVDGKALAKDFKEVEANGGGTYEEVPFGKYEVKIEKMELKESRKGDPMFTCWFKILEGDRKNSIIFMNQVITQAFQIHIVCEFLRSLGTEVVVDFDGNYEHFNDTILDVAEAVDGKLEFLIDYYEKKGFPNFKVEEIYDV